MTLRTRLIISYTSLSLLLILSVLIISNLLLEKQFNNYLQEKQEEINQEIVQSVLSGLETNRFPSSRFFLAIGERALNDGIILTIIDRLGNEIFCMSHFEGKRCQNMLKSIETIMHQRYPNFEGSYTEKIYALENNGISFGSAKLGFYGPFFYNDADVKFMEVLNTHFVEVAVVFLFIALILGFFMANLISKPIKAVTQKTQELENGNYTGRINFTSKTVEIDGLIENVNALASTLESQQSLKRRMAMDYTHEIRTPLAAIQLNLEGIIDGIFEPSNERIESIRQEILRLSRMVSDIDNITALQDNKLVLKKELFNFCEIVKHCLTAFEADFIDKNISLSLDAEQCELYAEKDKIISVVMNLISNAVKFTETDGNIEIAVKNQKDSVLFSVKDDGIGIGETDLPNIFDHLYRTDISRARNTGGCGIGLSITRAIVSAHEGTISVRSTIGTGTTFTVILPKATVCHISVDGN